MVELGNFALFLSLPVVIYAAVMPIIGVIKGKHQFIKSARYAIYANGILLTVAAIALVTAFLTNRFDVAYVYGYSSTNLALAYKIAAFYGGQAGSLLFWAWMLALYMVVVVYQNRRRNQELMPYVMFIAMTVHTFFVFIMTIAPSLYRLSKAAKNIAWPVFLALFLAAVLTLTLALILKILRKLDSKHFKEFMLIGTLIATILLFSSIGVAAKKPTDSNPFEKTAVANTQLQKQVEDAGYDSPPDGMGLNPMLQNYGMILHPPTLYMGYVGFTIPFAFAMAALLTGNLGTVWIVSTRKWTIFAWFFLGAGIILGAQWAYMELGWGGYWAWDPVENASFLPWLTGTAFMHSVMIQEKKNMLKIWNILLIIFTFSLSLFGTYLVRSGILSSVHTFGASSLGHFFLSVIFLSLILSLLLMAAKIDKLKSENELDSLLSREASFLINNLILVLCAMVVLWGTMYPLISEALGKGKPTVGPPFYNQIMVPFALALFLITAICPLIAWRRATKKNLAKNFSKPFLASIAISIVVAIIIGVTVTQQIGLFAGLIALAALFVVATVNEKLVFPLSALTVVGAAVYFAITTGQYVRFIVPGFLAATLIGSTIIVAKNKESRMGLGLAIGTISGLFLIFGSFKIEHPWALAAFFLLSFIVSTIVLEFYRGARIRLLHDKERAGSTSFEAIDIFRAVKAFGNLVWKNKRRYGGYIIHTGVVLMFIGITASSTWKITKEVNLREGETMDIQNYRLQFNEFDTYSVGDADNPTKIVYAANMGVWKKLDSGKFKFMKRIEPQKNLHPNKMKSDEENQPITEVDLYWDLKEDLYVILNGFDLDKKMATFKVFVNPLIVWIWIGGFVMMFGTIIVMWPDTLERKRLAARYGWGR